MLVVFLQITPKYDNAYFGAMRELTVPANVQAGGGVPGKRSSHKALNLKNRPGVNDALKRTITAFT
ncbi:hypothetical protein [Rhodothermus marinus]|jgi:hypothetical protein|uniref:hypothetical protein n=1 Tax=Rhodothermus marinus TaxID=29549 RepID=UPI001186EB7F|nr:hypothetical protein [Rhodothermus marinus]